MKFPKPLQSPRSKSVALEPLENRLLFTAYTISSIIADNRGSVIMTVNSNVNGATVNAQDVLMYKAGPSGNPANSDHIQVKTNVSYNSGLEQILIASKKNLPIATPYEIVVKGSDILNEEGVALDGNQDGTPGGTYRVVTSIKSHKVAVFATPFGNMIVKLADTSDFPDTIANFLHYANAGDWDGTFFNRLTNVSSDGIGVLQGGEFNVTSSNTVGLVPTLSPIPLEVNPSVESNGTVGTIAMARGSAANSATNTFFFNYTSNPALDTENGGYAAFGAISPSDSLSLAVLQAIATNDTVNLRGIGVNPPGQGAEFKEVPTDESNFDSNGNPIPPTPAEVAQELDDSLILLSRVSIEMNVGPAVTTPIPAVVTPLSVPAPANIPMTPAIPTFQQTSDSTAALVDSALLAESSNTSPLFNDTQITGGTSTVDTNGGSETITDTYVNGVLQSTTTVTTDPSTSDSGTFTVEGTNNGSTAGLDLGNGETIVGSTTTTTTTTFN
ncbi:MAG: peptidylprolyl isomerase [Tepidisphaeraceae bacterium]